MRLKFLFFILFFSSFFLYAQKTSLTGTASYYHAKFNGRKTATGEIFDNKKLTAACNVLPLGTMVKVVNLSNKKEVVVRINDRLHAKNKRLIDLTEHAAKELGFFSNGLCKVSVTVLEKNIFLKNKRKKIKIIDTPSEEVQDKEIKN